MEPQKRAGRKSLHLAILSAVHLASHVHARTRTPVLFLTLFTRNQEKGLDLRGKRQNKTLISVKSPSPPADGRKPVLPLTTSLCPQVTRGCEAGGGRVRRRFLRRHGPGGGGDGYFPVLPPHRGLFLLFLCPHAALRGLQSPTHASFFLPFTSPLITPRRLNVSEKGGGEAEVWATAQLKRCKAERTEGVESRLG